MSHLALNEAEFLFRSEALADPALRVHRFRGREAISQTFEFAIDLISDDPDLNLDEPIGRPASLTLRGRRADGTRYERHVHGVLQRLAQTTAGIRHSRYEATLVPTIKPLGYTRDSRIFQQLTTPDIIRKVLNAHVPRDHLSLLLHGQYRPRDYCVQYQESDLDFVQRLLEEEGIFYFFDQRADRATLVAGDGRHAFDSLGEYAELTLRDRPHLYEEGITGLSTESNLRPGATVLRDFRFKQPGLDLEARVNGERFTQYQMYYFPGEYVDSELGQRLARLRLEEQQCQSSRFLGQGNVRSMLPGHKFTLRGHRRRACNQEYLIVSVEHEGTQPGALGEEGSGAEQSTYVNRIECIPAGVMFRPSRATPQPSIPGVQTAVVVGPGAEEIHCDDHGRVKVQFHWDREGQRNDHSSCWIRVSQPWGGAGQGGMFIPRVGQEVIVQFLEGDPDRPLIVGRVYNGENPVPHGLPAAKSISTIRSASTPGGGGFNELRFNDTAGSEEVFFHAQKDHNEVIGNNHDTQVANNQSLHVGGNQNQIIGIDQSTTVGANQALTVGADRSAAVAANETLHVGANQISNVGLNQSSTVGLNQSLSISVNQDIVVGASQTARIAKDQTFTVGEAQTVSIGAAQTTKVGGNSNTSVGADIALTVVGNQTSTIGGAQQISVTGSRNVTVSADETINISGQRTTTVGGSDAYSIIGGHSLSVGGVQNLSIAQDATWNIGTTHSISSLVFNHTVEAVANTMVTGALTQSAGGPATIVPPRRPPS